MRTLFVCALAATVVGCSCYAPPLASVDTCTVAGASGLACLDRNSLSQAIEPEPAASDAGLPAPKARSKIAARTEKPPSAHARHKTDLAMTTTKSATPTANVEPPAAKVELAANKVEPAAPKVEPPASGRPAETSDQVIARAKTTIAAVRAGERRYDLSRGPAGAEQQPDHWDDLRHYELQAALH